MPSFDREDTITDVIERILDAIERAEPGERSLPDGSRGSGRPFDADYGFTVSWGLDPSALDHPVDPAGSTEHLVDSRREDDGMNVVADLPEVDRDDVEVRIGESGRLLEIRERGRVIDRVSLPWPAKVRTIRLNNGVLDVGIARLPTAPDDE